MKEQLLTPVKPQYCQIDTTPFTYILDSEENFETLDIETLEVLDNSEYLERLEIVWGDSEEWL